MRGWKRLGVAVVAAAAFAAPLAGQGAQGAMDARADQVVALADRVGGAMTSQDPADDLYRDARRAMNGEDWGEAARLFSDLRREHPGSAYVGDAYYFEAFSRHRMGSRAELERAWELLTEMQEDYPDATSAENAAWKRTGRRICSRQ